SSSLHILYLHSSPPRRSSDLNVYFNDGQREMKCIVSVELARRLGPHLRGPRIRFVGQGLWYRIDGSWQMKEFTADDFAPLEERRDRKSTRLNSSHGSISYAVF